MQGRDKREGQMETVKCGRVRESARQPDTTLLRPLKVTRSVVLVEDCMPCDKRNSKCKIHC